MTCLWLLRKNEVLGEKTTLLVHCATALAYGCRACIEHYLRMVKEGGGLTEEELGAVHRHCEE